MKKIIVSLILIIGCIRVGYSANPMTAASRTSGVMPLGVFFDTVDTADPAWSSGVIQPRGFLSQPVNCTGVRIMRVNCRSNLGIGTLTYTASNNSLTWAAPGGSGGSAVNVFGGGDFSLPDSDGESILHIWINPDELPISNMSDAVIVTDGGENADWASFHYAWDFGDPGSGTWDVGARKSDDTAYSKNIAFGWNAAHVYENPGTYIVQLTVIDDEGGMHEYTMDITATAEPDGGWTTYYFAEDGNDANAGTESNPFRTFAKAETLAANNVRLRFKRDDEFAVTDMFNPSVSGPLLLDAYGSGINHPRFVLAVGGTVFLFGRDMTDARFVDLWIDGPYPEISGDGFHSLGSNTLVLRCRVWEVFSSFQLSNSEYVVIQDCESVNGGNYFFYSTATSRSAVLGCTVTDGLGTQFLRTYANKIVLSHCHFERPLASRYSLRFLSSTSPGQEGLWIIASYNRLLDVGLNVQNDSDTVVPRHVLFEGNLYEFEIGSRIGINVAAVDGLTIRNNSFFMPGEAGYFLNIENGYHGNDSVRRNVRIYNNTVIQAGADWTRFARMNATDNMPSSNWQILNNVLYAPLADNAEGVPCISYNDVVATDWLLRSHNNCWYVPNLPDDLFTYNGIHMSLSQWQAAGTGSWGAQSTTSDPMLNANLFLIEGSPCIDTGTDDVLPWCRIDADGNLRLAGSVDMGAFEYGSGLGDPEPDLDIDPEPDPEVDPEPDPEPEPDDIYSQDIIPETTELKAFNSILKPGGHAQAIIQVGISETVDVKLTLYTAQGKEIQQLVNEQLIPGIYTYFWSGLDTAGNPVGSGIYFVHMQSGSYNETKKIAVIK
ncbi:MAG: choice-of-anchor Q domain-containing protein [Parcubacteria group bacterium]